MNSPPVSGYSRSRRCYQALAQIRVRWRGDSRYDRSFAKPWNNARLNAVATCYDLVPGFERLLKAKRGDLKLFYAAVETMRTINQMERRVALGGD